MIQRRHRVRLAREPLAELGFGDLDGHRAVQPRVAGLPHLAHAALAKRGFDEVRADSIAGGHGINTLEARGRLDAIVTATGEGEGQAYSSDDTMGVMATRQIDLDEECDRILVELSREYGGDVDRALGDVIKAYGNIESVAELSEAAQSDPLTAQRNRAERGFREGRFTAWEDVKRTNGL